MPVPVLLLVILVVVLVVLVLGVLLMLHRTRRCSIPVRMVEARLFTARSNPRQ